MPRYFIYLRRKTSDLKQKTKKFTTNQFKMKVIDQLIVT